MGSLKGSQTSTTTANPAATADYLSLLGQAQGVANTPYQAYTGQLVAPVNSQQTTGINNINANAGFASPYVSQAAGLATGAANPLTTSQIQNYESPYTQSVVNATQAQFNNQNQQQQAQLTGNNIAQGALGGNRTGVAAANLANQQQLAQAPVIAGLENQGYTQALQTAQQQYQTNPLNAANSIANFGISGQNAALQGANAQVGAGTLQQQTQQALDTANYGQYAQAQAYPFQTTQWLAGLEGAIAPGLGSSTTGPQPNQTAQYLGAGLAGGALLLSDQRAKQNIHKIGSTNDGQPLYRYQYKGSDQWHIGPIAQEVEKHHPEAVHAGLGGLKYVDLKAATDDSVAHKAHGGPVAGLAIGGTPWSFADGWVPQFSGVGSTAPRSVSLPSTQSPNINWAGLGNTKLSSNGLLASNPTYGGGNMFTDANGGSSSDPLPGLDASDYGEGFARGGVAGYADGGDPNDIDTAQWPVGPVGAPTADDPVGDVNRTAGLAMLRDQMDVVNPGDPYRMPDQASVDQWRAGTPATPVVAKDDSDDETSAAPVAGVGAPALLARPTVAPATPFARDDAKAGFGDTPDNSSGIGFGLLSKNAQLGLLSAGLGMLASRSPFLGNAIGEGGIGGLSAYSAAEAADQKAAQDKIKQAQDNRRIEMEATRLQQEAQRAADDFALRAQTAKETARHNQFTENEAPKGYRETANGLEAIPGGPADPAVLRAGAEAKRIANAVLDDDTVHDMAAQYLAGDRTVMQNLGRGQQGAENIVKLRQEIARQARAAGVDPKGIVNAFNEQAGALAGQRAVGTRAANISLAANEANNMIPIALAASDKLPRGQWMPINQMIQAVQKGSSSPELASFVAATNSLVNAYVRAVSPSGVPTDAMRQHAYDMLNAAQGPEAYKAVVATMQKEMQAALQAPGQVKAELRKGNDATAAAMPSAPAAPVPAGPPAAAINLLRANPALASQFDAKYGAGASRQYLGAQ